MEVRWATEIGRMRMRMNTAHKRMNLWRNQNSEWIPLELGMEMERAHRNRAHSTAVHTDCAILYSYRIYCNAYNSMGIRHAVVIHNASRLVGLRWTYWFEKQHVFVFVAVCLFKATWFYLRWLGADFSGFFFCRRPMAAPSNCVYFVELHPIVLFSKILYTIVYIELYQIYIKLEKEWKIKWMESIYFASVRERKRSSNFRIESEVCQYVLNWLTNKMNYESEIKSYKLRILWMPVEF